MHVLILNSEYPPVGGGAGNASAHIAASLLEQGYQVSVLTSSYADLPQDAIADGVRVIRLPARRRHMDRSSALEQTRFMLVAALWGLAWARKLKPDAILAFFGAPSGVAAWFWSFFQRIPYVVLLRGGDVPGFRPYDFATLHRFMAPVLRLVWKRAAAVVANSRGLKELGRAFEPRIPIQVIPNGVSAMHLDEERAWQPPHLLFVGRLVYQKGLDVLLDALVDLLDLDWQLTIVGDGPRLDWLQAKAIELGLDERIHFLGWQPRERLPERLHQANIFVYPSRHEGMPNALLEAMSAGLPAVATDIAGNEELITDGENGFLVEAENSAALRDALRTLLADQQLRERMGAAARQTAETSYTWEAVGRAYSDLLESILAD